MRRCCSISSRGGNRRATRQSIQVAFLPSTFRSFKHPAILVSSAMTEKDSPTPTGAPAQEHNGPAVAATGQQPASSGDGKLSNVVRGTAESILTKLEDNLSHGANYELEEGELLQQSEPGPLGKEGRDVEEVLNIISQSIYREGEGQLLMKLSDRTSLLSVVSHSLSAYITTLEPAPLQRLSARIATEVAMWMCKLFKFTDGAAYCHDDTREGLVRIARLALHKHYPRLSQDGFEALFSRPPVIYLTSSTYQETMQHVCRQLGLPQSTLRLLKAPTEGSGSSGAKLEDEIEKLMLEDKAAGRLPILCVANVHSSLIQHGLDVCAFERLCRRQDVWLHLEGNALAGLILVRNERKPVPTGDSMALTLGSWIGVPAVPFVTLYKLAGTETAATAAGLTVLNPSVRLNCLPLWCVLRSLGELQIQERIENIFQMLEVLNSKLGEFACLRILSQRTEDEKYVSVAELTKKDFDVSKIYRTVNPALAFQYVSESPPDLKRRVPPYFNNLNSWLGQTMQRDCGQVPLEIVDVETTGYVLRLCPFESLAFSGASLTDEDLAAFVEGIENQTSILNATVLQRDKFIALIGREMRLEHVEISHWAGLGGVRYIPSAFVDKLEKEGEEEVDAEKVRKNLESVKTENKEMIDHRNIQLVQHLRNSDSAFSLGEGPDGRICIRFGMVSMDTDVEELLKLVIKSGIELDEQLAQLQNMSEVIQKGIQQAQGELQKESDEAIWQEGILRHVPLVGSFYNWISPAQKLQIKGRCLSLQEGKLESSETIYKKKSVEQQQQKHVPNGVENPGLLDNDEHSGHNGSAVSEEVVEEDKANTTHQPDFTGDSDTAAVVEDLQQKPKAAVEA